MKPARHQLTHTHTQKRHFGVSLGIPSWAFREASLSKCACENSNIRSSRKEPAKYLKQYTSTKYMCVFQKFIFTCMYDCVHVYIEPASIELLKHLPAAAGINSGPKLHWIWQQYRNCWKGRTRVERQNVQICVYSTASIVNEKVMVENPKHVYAYDPGEEDRHELRGKVLYWSHDVHVPLDILLTCA